MGVCLQMQKLHFFSKNISVYAIFNDQSFNDTFTNNTVSFELGPEVLEHLIILTSSMKVSVTSPKACQYYKQVKY